MDPIGAWVRKDGEWALIHRCRYCGSMSSNRIAADDNPMKLMALAMRPILSDIVPQDQALKMLATMESQGDLI